MSIDDATPKEWDALKAERYFDNRPFPEPQCMLPADHREKMKRDRHATSPDPVNEPAHYRVGEVEAIDYINQQLGSGVKDYLLGNVHKYLHRHRFKGQAVEDLRKARWYLEKLIFEEVQGG